jgi:hypothetical protein
VMRAALERLRAIAPGVPAIDDRMEIALQSDPTAVRSGSRS